MDWEGYCTAGATVCARSCVTLEHVSSFSSFSFFLGHGNPALPCITSVAVLCLTCTVKPCPKSTFKMRSS